MEKNAVNGIVETFAPLYCTIFHTPHFRKLLEVLQDFHCLFGSRNSPTTGIVHTVRPVYWSMWPAREAKPRFGAALEPSVHDCETCLLAKRGRAGGWDVQQEAIILSWSSFVSIKVGIKMAANGIKRLHQSRNQILYIIQNGPFSVFSGSLKLF